MIKGEKLQSVEVGNFKLEIELQSLIEANLDIIFKLKFVKSEFSVKNFRIDTLAYDENNNSFVIIEYKRNQKFSIVDQGYSYLSIMLNNKADFVLEYNERFQNPIKRSNIDWSQSRVFFISPSFSEYQKNAVNFKDLPMELYKVTRYENNMLAMQQISNKNATENVKTLKPSDPDKEAVDREVKVFSEEDHLERINSDIRILYEIIKEEIIGWGNVEIEPKKKYIAFKKKRNFMDIRIQKKALKIWINLKKGELNDKAQICEDVSERGHFGNGDYQVSIKDENDLSYVISLIKQSYYKNR